MRAAGREDEGLGISSGLGIRTGEGVGDPVSPPMSWRTDAGDKKSRRMDHAAALKIEFLILLATAAKKRQETETTEQSGGWLRDDSEITELIGVDGYVASRGGGSI